MTNFANAFETTLRVDMGPSDLIAQVYTTEGAPASPCYLVIEPTDTNRREYIEFDGSFTADQFVTTTTENRYLTGSAQTSGVTHPAGSVVRFSPVAQHFTDLQGRIASTEAHSSATSPHLATSAATGNRLVLRDANARFQAASPSEATDVATKGYVDTHPKGTLAYTQVTAIQTGITTETDLTGLSVTANVAASRRVRITGSGIVKAIFGDSMIRGGIYVTNNNDFVHRWVDTPLLRQDETFRAEASVILTPTADSYTYKLTLEHAFGTGQAQLLSSADVPAFILVEDIGAA